jgi:hypothetical protein
VCRGDGALRLRFGAAIGGTDTVIRFDDEKSKLVQSAATLTLDWFVLERLALGLSVGTALDGHVNYRGTRYDLEPGLLAGLGASYRLFGGVDPFVHVSANLSVANSESRAPDGTRDAFVSRDARFGVAVGQVFGGFAAPFVVARYFTAGTEWETAGGKGADDFQYHVGAGSALSLSESFDALVEIAFLGERRLSLGVGYTY